MKLFRGVKEARVDDKARLKLPAPIFRALEDAYRDREVFVTSLDGETLKIYPLREWERIEATLMDRSDSKPEEDAARDERILFNANLHGADESLDKQGRILVPNALREAVGTSCEVYLTWGGTHIRVMSAARFEETKASMAMTAEDNMRATKVGA